MDDSSDEETATPGNSKISAEDKENGDIEKEKKPLEESTVISNDKVAPPKRKTGLLKEKLLWSLLTKECQMCVSTGKQCNKHHIQGLTHQFSV